MPATKASTRKSFGKRKRTTKARGLNSTGRPPASERLPVRSPSPSLLPAADANPTSSDGGSSPMEMSTGSADGGECQLTTFERKVALLCQGPADESEETPEPSGYRFVKVTAIKAVVTSLLCPHCHGQSLDLGEIGAGLNLEFVVMCRWCGEVKKAAHAPPVKSSRQPELSLRLVVASRNCGMNYKTMANFFAGMDAPMPMHHKHEGARGIKRVFDKLELEHGVQTMKHVQQATHQSIARAKARAMDSSKVEKKKRRLEAIATEQRRVEDEGPTYGAGHFD